MSLTNRATHLCKCNDVADVLKHAPPHVCYHAEFDRSALKAVRTNTGESTNWERGTPLSWDGKHGYLLEIHAPSPHVLPRQIG